ncbi:hypothetical protein ABZW18_17720 [Streptomyces sp. NPDC004647]|uniref:hypothetical protein n=1 Tax=Streptomyces sp. NPDC004647 TaxID=3154671 RepID=UPI0033AA3DC9
MDLQQPHIKQRHLRPPDDFLAEQYRHNFRWEKADRTRRPIFVVGPYSVDLIAAEDAVFRLHCYAYEALRGHVRWSGVSTATR